MKYEIWSSFSSRYCNFSIPHIIFWPSFTRNFFSTFWYEVETFTGETACQMKWRYQFDHMTLSQNDFWFVYCTLSTWPKWWCDIYQLPLPRSISGQSFSLELHVKVGIPGRVGILCPLNEPLCKKSSTYEGLKYSGSH